MNIILLEPFFSGSHRRWAEELQKNSTHNIEILSLKGHHWKWRMYGGAVSLAKKFNELKNIPDAILATDMLDLTTFLALTRKKSNNLPVFLYFHENQITYPWSPTDQDVDLKRNNQYGFLNYTSALAADKVFFNSKYHYNSFLGALPDFLRQFPDKREMQNVDLIKKKSYVLPLGMDLKKFDRYQEKEKTKKATLLWNHRWEYDKNPDLFFNTLFKLKEENIDFDLIVLGESYKNTPSVFEEAKKKLKDNILHFGYVNSFEEYAKWLWKANISPVTSQQDFFGGSVVEAIYCNCFPLLPNRLAYPEHIPLSKHKVHFFENENEFYFKLKLAILNVNENFESQYYVKQNDWSVCLELHNFESW